MNEINSCTLDEKIKLYAVPINIKIGFKVYVKLTFLDKNRNILAEKIPNNVFVKTNTDKEKYGISDEIILYEFKIRDLAKELNIKPKDIAYVNGWIDANNDREVSIEYDEVSVLEVVLITREMLEIVAPKKVNDIKLLEYLNKYARIYEVDTKYRIAHFLSQIAHESGFDNIEEEMNYNAKRMREIFGCKGGRKNYDKVIDDCKLGRLREKLWSEETKYANNPKNLANYVYAKKDLGNGNEQSGDGYKYRARGIMQLTGRSNYKMFTNKHNQKNPDDIKDFVKNPDLILSDKKYGVESAFIFWENKNINLIANGTDVNSVTLKVNGGLNGFSDRETKFNNLIKIME